MDIFQGTGAPLTAAGFDHASTKLGIAGDIASLWSILSVETRGFGYLTDKRPKILFERHIFHKRTGGRFSAAHPDISNPKAGGYSGGAAEYGRLFRAISLDRMAAIESASWGLGQVMGFNAVSLGYGDASDMVDQFKSGEDAQLDGCARFVVANPALLAALRARKWPRVAFFYNGADYAKNAYDTKLSTAYDSCTRKNPDVAVRACQARLLYAGFAPNGIDGVFGPGTIAALNAFQRSKNMPITSSFDAETNSALLAAAGV